MKASTFHMIALTLGLITVTDANAQTPRNIRGRVLDGTTGTAVKNAVVRDPDQKARAVVTGADGSFVIDVQESSRTVIASRVGFAAETLYIAAASAPVTIRLMPTALEIDGLIVSSERTFSAASASSIRQIDLKLRPRQSSQDLLRMVPGLVIAQHGGGGKAEQIFMRGFDADHGTDVAITVDGIPVNMVSHGHGQGYADLHFLLPEAVERVDVRKGPYDARDGDFATAGAVSLYTRDRIEAAQLSAEVGSFGRRRALVLVPFGGEAHTQGGWAGLSLQHSQGPFQLPQAHRRINAFAKYTAPVGDRTGLVLTASGFNARWNQSGQIPERAIRARLIDRFGSVDNSEGGRSARYDVSVAVNRDLNSSASWTARAYLTHYDFDLFSNFTFFLNDSINGDGIEQRDKRYVAGLNATYTRGNPILGRPARFTWGVGSRSDLADVGLFKQRQRVVVRPLVEAGVFQHNFYSYVDYQAELSPRLRVQGGLRLDALAFQVDDHLAPAAAVSKRSLIANPKLNVAFEAAAGTIMFANVGSGFHSNDARTAVQRSVSTTPLARAVGAEVGMRTTHRDLSAAVAFWRLDLEQELIYVGDEGMVEPSSATRRVGIDLEARARLRGWVWADLDVNLARGRFVDRPADARTIPLAPTVTSTAGLTLRNRGPSEAGLRYRLIGSRPANETATLLAQGHFIWQAFGQWEHRQLKLFAAIDNLFDAEWNEAQFEAASRLLHEPEGVSELHVTPGAPRSFSFGVRYAF